MADISLGALSGDDAGMAVKLIDNWIEEKKKDVREMQSDHETRHELSRCSDGGITLLRSARDPKRAAELGRMGGRQNRHYVETEDVIISPPSTPQEIKNILSQAMADVRARKLDPRIASALTYMAGALLKAFETTEVHERLARLEADMQNKADKQ